MNEIKNDLTFKRLREADVQRTEQVFEKLTAWSPTDWACAMAGECGEACNQVKKLRRLDGGPVNTILEEEVKSRIGRELADLIIYADLLAARLGLDLDQEIIAKFNQVSRLTGSSVTL